VHWRFSTKLSSSICIQGSLSGMPQSLEVALHMFFIQFFWRTSLHSSDVELQLMDIDSCKDVSGLLEQVIIIVFSLHLGEPLVLDLAMLSFISLSYIVLHHDFQFLCLIAFIEFISGWQSCDS
jgi:hypothetical protein